MLRSRGLPALVFLVIAVLAPGSQAVAALIPSVDGTVVYDTVNNISWLADANLGALTHSVLRYAAGLVRRRA